MSQQRLKQTQKDKKTLLGCSHRGAQLKSPTGVPPLLNQFTWAANSYTQTSSTCPAITLFLGSLCIQALSGEDLQISNLDLISNLTLLCYSELANRTHSTSMHRQDVF